MDFGDLYYCEAFPSDMDDYVLDENSSPPQNDGQFFNINVELIETKLVPIPNMDTYDCLNDKTTEYQFPSIPCTAMEESKILRMLSDIGVPEDAQNFMAFKILACAQDMVRYSHKTDKLLPMQVLIYITTSIEQELDMDDESIEEELEMYMDDEDERDENEEQEQEGFEEHFMEDQLDTNLVPETISYDELERVKVLGLDVGRCTICLEGYLPGSEAVKLPCLHLYHQSCIVEWLQKSSSLTCPLCRSPMPRATSKD